MGTISVNLPADGTGADAADYNEPINTIVDEINGNLDSGNLANSAVTEDKITDDAVSSQKIEYGKVYKRQGGDAVRWSTTGTTNYDTDAAEVKIQCGSHDATGTDANHDITFPEAFTDTPIIIATPFGSSGVYPTWYLVSATNTGFTFREGTNVEAFHWVAIGV